MSSYIANKILLVPPYSFAYNPQTADTNFFQHSELDANEVNFSAMREFEEVLKHFDQHKINYLLLNSLDQREKLPDAVFPNWFSVHTENDKREIVIYPMLTQNRKKEVKLIELGSVFAKNRLETENIFDMRGFAKSGEALEATGSMILDRKNKVVYVSNSARTNSRLLKLWAEHMHYSVVSFETADILGRSVYHTDLMLNIWRDFSIICPGAVVEDAQRKELLKRIHSNSLFVLELDLDQLGQMCGNIIQISNKEGEPKILLSKTAYTAFKLTQRKLLEKLGELVIMDIETIESVGGGSVRCMVAELY